MKVKPPTLPIIIRIREDKEGRTAVAFFPTLPGSCEADMLCYERIGQHGHADVDYVSSCVTPKNTDANLVYELFSEISRIYETGEGAVKLAQRRRLHQNYHDTRKKNYLKNSI